MKIIHKHVFEYICGEEQKPLIVSGYGMTEYEIKFCIKCGKLVWRIVRDVDNLYPKIRKEFK